MCAFAVMRPHPACKSAARCCLVRSGWYEFTHTASSFNITATDKNLGNITGAADSAFAAIKDTRTTLLAAGNPSLKVLPLTQRAAGVFAGCDPS